MVPLNFGKTQAVVYDRRFGEFQGIPLFRVDCLTFRGIDSFFIQLNSNPMIKMRLKQLFAVCGVILFLAGCATDPKESKEFKDLRAELDKYLAEDSLENANIALYKKLAEINDTTELPQLDALIASDVNFHDMPEGMPNGLVGFKQLLHGYFTAIPQMQMDIKHILAKGDIVIAHMGLKGVNSGPNGPAPATGKSIDVEGYDCVRIENGKVVEYWSLANEMKMMTQLGLMPEM